MLLSLILLIGATIAGGSIAYANEDAEGEFPTSVHENNRYDNDYERIIQTETEGTEWGFVATTAITLSRQKTATTTVVVPHSYLTAGYTVRAYSKLINKNGNVSSTPATCNTFSINSITGYYQCQAVSSLPALAYAGKTRHEVSLYYFTGDAAVLGADIAIYYN